MGELPRKRVRGVGKIPSPSATPPPLPEGEAASYSFIHS